RTVKTALTLWKQFGGRVTSAEILRIQMGLYKNWEPPFKDKFIESVDNIPLQLNAITPHNAVCERVFSILNWYMGKYRTKNLQDKLMQVFDEITYAMIEECDMFDDKNENNYKEEEFADEESNEEKLSDTKNGNISQLEIENFICLEHRILNNNDDDISSNSDVINHGDPNFDIDTLLDKLE
ncbi:16740_t:CDS:2, partial [Racocetra persica]